MRMKFMNISIDNLTMDETLFTIEQLIKKKSNAYVVTPNVDHIVKLEDDEKLTSVYKNADLVLTDGKPLIWISRLYKNPIKEKISGSDLFPKLCELSAKKNYKMFLLGAAEGVAAKAAANLTERYPGLDVVATYSPPFGFEKDNKELEKIIHLVNSYSPDILIVGLGCPKQEFFIYDQLDRLNVPISLGLGASIDFEAGNVKRAPKWMRNHGFEWLYRLLKEPKRMFKRYIIEDLRIVKLIWKYHNV